MTSNPFQITDESQKNKVWAKDIVETMPFIPIMQPIEISINESYYNGTQSTKEISDRLNQEIFKSQATDEKKDSKISSVNNNAVVKPNKFLQSMLQIIHGENMSKELNVSFRAVDKVSNPHKKEVQKYLKNVPIINNMLGMLGSSMNIEPKDIKKMKMKDSGDPLDLMESMKLNPFDDDDIDFLVKTKFKPKSEIVFEQAFNYYRTIEIADKVTIKDLMKKVITQSHLCYRIYRSKFNGLPVLKLYDCDQVGVSHSVNSNYKDAQYSWVKENVKMGDFLAMVGDEIKPENLKNIFKNSLDKGGMINKVQYDCNSYYNACSENGSVYSALNKNEIELYYITVKSQNAVNVVNDGKYDRVESKDYNNKDFETSKVKYRDTVYSFYYIPSFFKLLSDKTDCIFQFKEVFSFFKDPEYNDKAMSDICIFKIQDGIPLIENAKEHIDNISLIRHKFLNELYELKTRNYKINLDQVTEVANMLESDEAKILNLYIQGFNFFKTFDPSSNDVTKSGSYGHSSDNINSNYAVFQTLSNQLQLELEALRRAIGFNETRDVGSFNRSDIVSLNKIAQGQSYFSTSYIDYSLEYFILSVAKRCTYITQQILSSKKQLGYDLLIKVLGEWAVTEKDFKDISMNDVGIHVVHKLSEPEKQILIQKASTLLDAGIITYSLFLDIIENRNIKETALLIDYHIEKEKKKRQQEQEGMQQAQFQNMQQLEQSKQQAKMNELMGELELKSKNVIVAETEKLKADIERNNQKHIHRLEQLDKRKDNTIVTKVAEKELSPQESSDNKSITS